MEESNNSNILSQPPSAPDPHWRRWMMFVDGENLTIRGQEFAKKNHIALSEGKFFTRDGFVWLPGNAATWNPTYSPGTRIHFSWTKYLAWLVAQESK
jgi:hypothetical protein